MISSQALMINVVSLFSGNEGWLTAVLNALFSRANIKGVLSMHVEFAPRRRSLYFNDMTMIDWFVLCQTTNAVSSVVFEFKYADRLNARHVPISDNWRYARFFAEQGLWRDGNVLVDRRFNQLARVHALGSSVLAAHPDSMGLNGDAHLAVIADSNDSPAKMTTYEYSKLLYKPELVSHRSLDALLDILVAHAPNSALKVAVEDLKLRYVDLGASDYLIAV